MWFTSKQPKTASGNTLQWGHVPVAFIHYKASNKRIAWTLHLKLAWKKLYIVILPLQRASENKNMFLHTQLFLHNIISFLWTPNESVFCREMCKHWWETSPWWSLSNEISLDWDLHCERLRQHLHVCVCARVQVHRTSVCLWNNIGMTYRRQDRDSLLVHSNIQWCEIQGRPLYFW